MQCLCHTSVDSQEDKRVGVTKDHRKESHPLLKNTPTPIKHPACRREEEEVVGDEGRCCCSAVVRRCGRTGDKQGAVVVKEETHAGRGLRPGVQFVVEGQRAPRPPLDVFFHPFLILLLCLLLSPAEHS